MNPKLNQLSETIKNHASQDLCIAFSGGVDSSLLLKIACDAAAATGHKVYAVTFDTRLHPSCDLAIAKRVAEELKAIHDVIYVDELEQQEIRMNPVNRCYLCKKRLFQTLREYARDKDITLILDGTNEDDMHVYRPGIQALKELGIISPLADLHITKQEVKDYAAYYGLSVASRPSTPCMATRLPYNTEINYTILELIGQGEEYLRNIIGGNVRLRLHQDIVRIEVDQQSFPKMIEKYEELVGYLKNLGFLYITLDLEGFRSGSMDVMTNHK